MQNAQGENAHIMMIKSLVLLLVFSFFFIILDKPQAQEPKTSWWEIQSVDVMKYSRDIAREKLKDKSFDRIIDEQVKDIAETGATHIAIGTPYDEEFLPFLKRWVVKARQNGLKVWFRGNFSGWEKWFEYEGISREEHTIKIKEFILKNPDLFEDGDLFTSCPECENGGPGDPRMINDKVGHQNFLISEYKVTKDAFNQIGKNVMANTYSMNGDVARLVMDENTTKELDGVVVIDHYVQSPDRLVQDIENYSIQSGGGKIILGEFGAPIPDIHGQMDQQQQADYLNTVFEKLSTSDNLIGINYWVSVGGSTQLWDGEGTKRMAADVLKNYFTPTIIKGQVINEIGQPIKDAEISAGQKTVKTDIDGKFTLAVVGDTNSLMVQKDGYNKSNYQPNQTDNDIYVLRMNNPGTLYQVLKSIYSLFTGLKLGQN